MILFALHNRDIWKLRDYAFTLPRRIQHLHYYSRCSSAPSEEQYRWYASTPTPTTWLFLKSSPISSDATPGYFSLTLNNSIQMEATATRRAGLERFTFPANSQPYFVLDLANDLPASFNGGELTIDPTQGRIMIGGQWGSRY
jgi:putative alpha-1,2-mannosidase